jgi:hypothetical protein
MPARAVHHFPESRNDVKLALSYKGSTQPRFQRNETHTCPAAETGLKYHFSVTPGSGLAWKPVCGGEFEGVEHKAWGDDTGYKRPGSQAFGGLPGPGGHHGLG